LLTSTVVLLTLVAGGQGLLIVAASAQAIEGWGQFQGDAAHTGFVADAVQPPYQPTWHLDVPLGGPNGTFGLSEPVVDGSSVIAVAPESIVAADLATGRELWDVERDYGPSVSPAVAATPRRRILIYTEGFGDDPPESTATPSTAAPPSSGSTSGSDERPLDSHISAIDLDTQEPVWDTPVQLDAVSRTGVTVDGDTAYVGDNTGTVYAIDVATGAVRWTADAGGFLTTALAVSDGAVVATVQGDRTSRSHLIAFAVSDGSESWDEEISGEAVFASAPVIVDGTIVAGFSDRTVRAFALSDGSDSWSTRLNRPMFFTGAPAFTPDAVVVADAFGQVYRLDPVTGERLWDFAVNEPVTRSPVVVAGGTVLVATSAGRLSAIDLESGLLVWQSEFEGGLLRSLVLSSETVVGVRGGIDPGLVGFTHDPNGTLISLVSPTELDLPKLLGNFLAAAVPLALLLLLAGRWLTKRMGPAFLDDDDEGDALELVDEGIEGSES
jgi:outer membrane protein assembly factor BamB